MAKAEEIAQAFSDLLTKLDALCPTCRERSLAVTTLQEAAFWAKRAVAVMPGNAG